MSYYVINANTEQIIDIHHGHDVPDIQELANFFECPVYLIRGEHSGLSAEPRGELPLLTGQEKVNAEVAKLRRWNEGAR